MRQKEGLEHDSSGRVAAFQEESPDFKPQLPLKLPKQSKNQNNKQTKTLCIDEAVYDGDKFFRRTMTYWHYKCGPVI
jgi:hypothetical protein